MVPARWDPPLRQRPNLYTRRGDDFTYVSVITVTANLAMCLIQGAATWQLNGKILQPLTIYSENLMTTAVNVFL